MKIRKVEEREGVGRTLVATRDIQPLELVLWDKVQGNDDLFVQGVFSYFLNDQMLRKPKNIRVNSLVVNLLEFIIHRKALKIFFFGLGLKTEKGKGSQKDRKRIANGKQTDS